MSAETALFTVEQQQRADAVKLAATVLRSNTGPISTVPASTDDIIDLAAYIIGQEIESPPKIDDDTSIMAAVLAPHDDPFDD